MDSCGDWLMQDEVGNNGILSIAKAIGKKKSAFKQNPWLATLLCNNEVKGCVMIIEPDGLVVSDLPPDSLKDVRQAIDDSGGKFARISGPFLSAGGIAEVWSDNAGFEWAISHEWRAFSLNKVTMPKKKAEGSLRLAKKEEREIISEWGSYYEEEKPAPVSVTKFLLYKLDEGELYVWDNDGAKTLVAVSGKTKNCARVSAVFTPKEFRGNGYASIAVGEITQGLLDTGKKSVTLLVDKHDPKVMRIYKRLGYERIGSKVNIAVSKT